MLTLLIYFVIVCVVLWGVKYIVPMPAPLDKVYYVVCVLVALGFFVYTLQAFGLISAGRLPRLR
jgi:hypothetical protein